MYSAYNRPKRVFNPQTDEPTRTKQAFKKECDINEIVARMRKGIVPPAWMTQNTPRYGDFSNLPATFMEAHAIVETAAEAFKSLPLEFRRALDHDPRNLDKAPLKLYEQFGLVKKKTSENASGVDSSNFKADPLRQPTGGPSAPSGANKTPQGMGSNADV